MIDSVSEHQCPTGICQIKHVPRSRALCHACTARLSPRLADRLADAWNEGLPARHYPAVLSVVIAVVQLRVERERIVR